MVISGVNTVTYNGDGITTAWPYTYEVTDASEIRIQLNNADGTATIVESDYYVDLINSTVYYPGYAPGSEPPEAEQPPKVQEGQTITVYREIPITQESDLGEKWPFEVIEKGLDKLTMIAQQIDSGTKRTIDNALASMELLADVVVDSGELQHITDQLNEIDDKAEAAADSAEDAEASATAAANSATAASTSATNAANSDASATATAAALTAYLETKTTLTAPAVDATLTIAGAAADAKVTGDRMSLIDSNVFNVATKIATQSINYVAGSGHSSANDKFTVNIPTGNAFYVLTDTKLPYLILYAWYSDGTSASLGSFNNAIIDRSFVASKDIVAFSYYWSSPSTSGTFTYTVQYGLKGDLFDIKNNLDVLGNKTSKTISYTSGTAHSSDLDRHQMKIPQGTKYRITAIGTVTTVQIFEYYNDNTYTSMGTLSAPFDVEYTAVHDVAALGYYWAAQTAGGSITFTVQFGIPNDVAKLQERTDDVVHPLDNAKHIAGGNGTPLTLVHISDIHAESSTLNRIVDKCKTFNYDDMICTGDMAAGTYAQIDSWWDPNILTCIGNHDTASYDAQTGYNWTALSMADRDTYYIAPFESNWGTISHTAGTSYYYKDYSTQKVRLIVMDAMLYNDNGAEATAQTTWLASTLADAITNNLHVLVAIHAPHGGAEAVDCSFSRYGQTTIPSYADCNTPQVVIDTVQMAKNNGLNFIGYICGHTHQDNMWDAENNGEQIMYCITCAGVQYALWKNSDQDRSITEDAFNVVTIDTAHTLVKIIRGGGADMDDHMRTRKAICFDYSTGEVVGEIL